MNKTILANKTALVIGFGKIGKGAAKSLAGRKCNVYVYDHDPVKLIEASALGFQVDTNKKDLLKIADIVVGCTGNYALTKNEFKHLKDGVLLASGSSKQKEFEVNYLFENYKKKHISDQITRYSNKDKSIRVVYDGMPINFIDLGIIGDYLVIVWLEIIYALKKIQETQDIGLFELNKDERNGIAEYWLESFLVN